ncbi:hypothetical protein HDU86_001218 [Geranomyces michiganensis]|nr:hypothetical protein HDU86_001218 [Geranomyces michiganensis]
MADVKHYEDKKDVQTIVEDGQYVDDREDAKHLEREAALNRELDAKIAANPDKLPKAIWFIIPNEFGERFCYYGINPILKKFLNEMLGYSKSKTNSIQHTWKSVTYFTPLIGAAASDSFLDKFKTIVSLSFVYLAGLIMLSITAKPGSDNADGTRSVISAGAPLAALFLISLGTGGIKPCVSSHGGDQFLASQSFNINKFYNYFYMSINLGSLVSGFVTPNVKKMNCYGHDGDCFAWAFGICAAAFGAALALFIIGKKWYRVVPPSGQFFPWILFKAALTYVFRGRAKAEEAHSHAVVLELVDLVKVFYVISPVIVFWLGFDQGNTTWQDTSDQMSDKNWLSSEITNAVVNPFWIVTLAPIFANFLYPAIEKRVQFGLLRRMILGMFFAAFSFILMGLLQRKITNDCVDEVSQDANGKDQTMCMDKSVNTAVMLVPYFFVTVAEVLVSISGLNLTYMEVGRRTKSSSAALWLLGVGVANAIGAVIMESPLGDTEQTPRDKFYFIMAGVCVGAGFLQGAFAWSYTYRADRVVKA